jgi:hypothetical protein
MLVLVCTILWAGLPQADVEAIGLMQLEGHRPVCRIVSQQNSLDVMDLPGPLRAGKSRED